MNSNEVGTIITTLRDSEKSLFLVLGHLEEMRQRGGDYEALEAAYSIIHDVYEAAGNAIRYMQGVQITIKR